MIFHSPEPSPNGAGTDLEPLRSFLGDDALSALSRMARQALRFAQDFADLTRRLKPDHSRETRDRSAQFALQRLVETDEVFRRDHLSLSTEKYGWIDIETEYSPHLLRSRSSPISRSDALLLVGDHALAIELDHGNTISDWFSKLLKASRMTLFTERPGISGPGFGKTI